MAHRASDEPMRAVSESERWEAELFRAFEADPTRVVEFLKWLAERYGLPLPPRVLDLGCGTGRVLEPLARLGWRARGLEPNPAFRAAAREAAEPVGASVSPGGFQDVDAEDAFDLVIAVNSSFAHVVSAEERQDALRRCRRALVPGGALLLDVPNYVWILSHYGAPEDRWAEWRGRRVRLRRWHEVDPHAAVFTTREEYAVFEPAGESGEELELEPLATHEMVHPYAILTYPEVAFQLKLAGFGETETFSSYGTRTPEPLTGERMMVTARRPLPESGREPPSRAAKSPVH